jgi:hypothetical protein
MTPENQTDSLALNDKLMSAWEAAAAMGIDMSLIEYNLSLTPDQRAYQHDCALRTILMLERAGEQLYGKFK